MKYLTQKKVFLWALLSLVLVAAVFAIYTAQSRSEEEGDVKTPPPQSESYAADASEKAEEETLGEIESQKETAKVPDPENPAENFSEWIKQAEPDNAEERNIRLQTGLELAKHRREAMMEWILEDPERALDMAITPRQHERLPEAIRKWVEKPIAEVGFYGVLATCNHGSDEEHSAACEISYDVVINDGTPDAEFYKASIYGERYQYLSEGEASLYGVVLEDRIALHEYDAVLIDDGPDFPGDRYAVYYQGEAFLFNNQKEAEALQEELNTEARSRAQQ